MPSRKRPLDAIERDWLSDELEQHEEPVDAAVRLRRFFWRRFPALKNRARSTIEQSSVRVDLTLDGVQ